MIKILIALGGWKPTTAKRVNVNESPSSSSSLTTDNLMGRGVITGIQPWIPAIVCRSLHKCECNNRSKITIIDLNIIIIVILFETVTYVSYCIIIDAKAEAAYCNRQLYNQCIHYYRHGNNIPDMWYIIIRPLYYVLGGYCYRFLLPT